MDALAAAWREEMQALRADEAQRGDAAVQRLDELQAAVAQHLATLGAALEAPLARLLQTASEVPQAAAGVLAQLRAEMARLSEQENVALAERSVLVERLGTLVQAVEDASRQAGEMAAQAGANALELSSWGEAFGQAVQQFHASNEKLVTALAQVEGAVSRSTARSDEQLAYYVAQAREVIDLSIASQHGVIERLRELAGKPAGIAPGITG
jgi:chromosome segregation ATPase